VRDRYSDFGPTLAAEKLAEHHGCSVLRETLRGWMIADGLWQDRRHRLPSPHQPRSDRLCREPSRQTGGAAQEPKVRRLSAGGNWIRTFGSARDRLRFKALSLVGRLAESVRGTLLRRTHWRRKTDSNHRSLGLSRSVSTRFCRQERWKKPVRKNTAP
jgi:hypothetical protein